MRDTVVEIQELKDKLEYLGLDRVVFLSLGEEKREKITDHLTSIDLEISLEPMKDWKRSVGKFYEDKRGYDEILDWRTEKLQTLFDQNNIIAYFMNREPGFRLSNKDNLLIVKSMLTHINEITGSGIIIQNIGNKPYGQEAIKEATYVTKKIEFEPYITGEGHRNF